MDLNYILIWLVAFSSAALLFRCLSHERLRRSGWLVVALILAATVGVSFAVAPDMAGYISGVVWVLIVVLPGFLAGRVARLIAQQQFGPAARLAHVVRILHPADGWREQPRVLQALAMMRDGRRADAVALLERMGSGDTALGRYATLQLMRVDNRWSDIIEWVDARSDRNTVLRNPGCFGLYLRALGEQGRADEMLNTARKVLPNTVNPLGPNRNVLMLLAALAGRPSIVENIFSGTQGTPDQPTQALQNYWIATAHMTAGEPEIARALLEGLDETDDSVQRTSVLHRLSKPLEALPSEALSAENQAFLNGLEQELTTLAESGSLTRPVAQQKRPVATWAILAVLFAVFMVELPGGPTNGKNLVELGALIGPGKYLDGEYWRVITAGFLHFGWLHLVLNMAGLWYFGRFLERAIGVGRYIAIYLLSSIGAFSMIVLAADLIYTRPFVMVGASASLMGLVGASALLMWRAWRKTRSRVLRQQLFFLLLLLAFQTTFDLMTPAVSFTAHMGGAVMGLVLAAVLAKRPKA